MNRHSFAACLIVGCTSVVLPAARAQQFGAADNLYSTGVQTYFGGRPAEAEASFSSLLQIDPKDPRAYYFRALSRMQQGREAEARSDLEVGAQMEAHSPYRFDIGKTLERVQGPTRLLLEQYRSRARTAASVNPSLGPVRAADAAVLRERRIVPLDQFSGSGEPHSIVAPEPPPVAPPQAITARTPVPPIQTSDLNAAPAAAGNPFADDSAAGPAPKSQPKAAQSKTPPAKAVVPESPPAKPPIPPAAKPAVPAPKASSDDTADPFQ
jgi:hypothetical protein